MTNSNKLIKSKKYQGVYTKLLKNNQTALYIAYTNDKGQYNKYKVGIKDNLGMNEAFASDLRNKEIQRVKLGECTILANKQRVVLFQEIGEDYLLKQEIEELKQSKPNKNRYYKHIYPIFKNSNLKNISSQDITNFKHKKLKELRPATVFHLINFINSIFNHAINRTGKYKGTNPAYKIFTKKEFNNNRERYLTLEEIDLLLNTIQNTNHEMKFYVEMFVRISLSTGARVNAILGLIRSDININTREINLYDAKNKEYYRGYLSSKMVNDEKLYKLLDKLNKDDFIFFYKSTRILIKKLHRFTYPIFKELFNFDIDIYDEKHKVCHHTLRHTFATHAVKCNDIFLVQKLLNHKDINMTLRYAKVDESKKRAAIEDIY